MGKKTTRFQWERDAPETDEEDNSPPPPSRAQLKREERQLKQLVKQLLELGDGQIQRLPISEDLQEALIDAKRLLEKTSGRSGYRRQLLRVAGLLRVEEIDAVKAALHT